MVAMPGADRMLLLEATATLAVARIIVLTVPFRFLAGWLSRAPDRVPGNDALLKQVRKAITIAARNVPWNAVCLPQAMAAKAMLARRGCGSAFHLGAAFDPNGKLIAHAWLTVGETIVVGAAGKDGMAHLARFG